MVAVGVEKSPPDLHGQQGLLTLVLQTLKLRGWSRMRALLARCSKSPRVCLSTSGVKVHQVRIVPQPTWLHALATEHVTRHHLGGEV